MTPTEPIAVLPTLDQIVADPRLVARLDATTVKALMLRATVAQSALATRLLSDEPAEPLPEDRMLTPDEAAQMLRRSRLWIYRNSKRLPFVKRISRKSLLCSEAGVKRWLATRKA